MKWQWVPVAEELQKHHHESLPGGSSGSSAMLRAVMGKGRQWEAAIPVGVLALELAFGGSPEGPRGDMSPGQSPVTLCCALQNHIRASEKCGKLNPSLQVKFLYFS